MPPYTTLPRPEGHVYISYNPMSPPNWGMAPFETHVFVYRNVRVALQAILQAATTIHAQRLEAGSATLFSEHLYFRGQSDISHRLLPTRLRGSSRAAGRRERFSVADPPKVMFNGIELPSAAFESDGDPTEYWGDWYERLRPMRSIEDSQTEVPDAELGRRDRAEQEAIRMASNIADVGRSDSFRRRAAVRHYCGVPSSLLDVSTDPEVAAFFATGNASNQDAGKIGLLWALDLNLFSDLFSIDIASVPGGLKIDLRELREQWGDNKAMFEEYGIAPASIEVHSVELPFRRPQAQRARFLSLGGAGSVNLPAFSELAWWSIIERRSYACAFLHDGARYENPAHNISRAALLPSDEDLAIALQQF